MFLTKKAIPRRTFLRSAQAALALPLLDAMIPAATAWAQTPAKPVPRLGFVFIPMGSDQARWTPPGQGKLDELSPILTPLKPVKDQVTVITNLRLPNAYPGTHDTSNSAFLSAASAKHTESSDYFLGTTVDQIAAKQMGRETQLASLQLAMDLNPLAGVCNNGYSCVYQNCLSWSSPTTPLPSEAHPRVVFERLFGEGGNADARRSALRNRASLLDSFTKDIARFKQRVGVPDRARLDQYLDSVRQVEREIERAEKGGGGQQDARSRSAGRRSRGVRRPCQAHVRPADSGLSGGHHARHRLPTHARAEQSHVSGDRRERPAPSNQPSRQRSVKVAQIAKINTYHVSLFSEFLQRMKATPDGDGSLLDHSVYLYGSGMGNPSLHDHENLPILVAGGASTGLKGGRHIRYEKGTNLSNLHLTLLDRVGIHLDSFVDSTGKIEDLFERVDVA